MHPLNPHKKHICLLSRLRGSSLINPAICWHGMQGLLWSSTRGPPPLAWRRQWLWWLVLVVAVQHLLFVFNFFHFHYAPCSTVNSTNTVISKAGALLFSFHHSISASPPPLFNNGGLMCSFKLVSLRTGIVPVVGFTGFTHDSWHPSYCPPPANDSLTEAPPLSSNQHHLPHASSASAAGNSVFELKVPYCTFDSTFDCCQAPTSLEARWKQEEMGIQATMAMWQMPHFQAGQEGWAVRSITNQMEMAIGIRSTEKVAIYELGKRGIQGALSSDGIFYWDHLYYTLHAKTLILYCSTCNIYFY